MTKGHRIVKFSRVWNPWRCKGVGHWRRWNTTCSNLVVHIATPPHKGAYFFLCPSHINWWSGDLFIQELSHVIFHKFQLFLLLEELSNIIYSGACVNLVLLTYLVWWTIGFTLCLPSSNNVVTKIYILSLIFIKLSVDQTMNNLSNIWFELTVNDTGWGRLHGIQVVESVRGMPGEWCVVYADVINKRHILVSQSDELKGRNGDAWGMHEWLQGLDTSLEKQNSAHFFRRCITNATMDRISKTTKMPKMTGRTMVTTFGPSSTNTSPAPGENNHCNHWQIHKKVSRNFVLLREVVK